MSLYSLLFMGNTLFSIYLVFGKVYGGDSSSDSHGNNKDEGPSVNDTVGQESFLAKQLFELLFPGTFLIPYITWCLTGYPLRRLLRLHNNCIPFTDDVRSARVLELRKAET